jgi:hypothetical protein
MKNEEKKQNVDFSRKVKERKRVNSYKTPFFV